MYTCGQWEHYHNYTGTPEKLGYPKIYAMSKLHDQIDGAGVCRKPDGIMRGLRHVGDWAVCLTELPGPPGGCCEGLVTVNDVTCMGVGEGVAYLGNYLDGPIGGHRPPVPDLPVQALGKYSMTMHV